MMTTDAGFISFFSREWKSMGIESMPCAKYILNTIMPSLILPLKEFQNQENQKSC